MPDNISPIFLDASGQPLRLDTNLSNVNLNGSFQSGNSGGLRFADQNGAPVTIHTRLSGLNKKL